MHVEACGHRARTISATSSVTDFLPAFQRPSPNGGNIPGPGVPQRVQQEALWRLAANALPMPGPCFVLRRRGKLSPSGPAFRRAMVWERVASHKQVLVVCAWLRVRTVDNKTHHHEAVYTTSDTTKHVACLFFWNHTHRGRAHYLQHTHASSQSSEAAGKGGPSASLPEDDDES